MPSPFPPGLCGSASQQLGRLLYLPHQRPGWSQSRRRRVHHRHLGGHRLCRCVRYSHRLGPHHVLQIRTL